MNDYTLIFLAGVLAGAGISIEVAVARDVPAAARHLWRPRLLRHFARRASSDKRGQGLLETIIGIGVIVAVTTV